jgi:histidinol phosphatase-like enzyme
MLLTAAREHEIDLTASWMAGDSDIDIEACRNASCRTVQIVKAGEVGNGRADLFARSLLDAAHQMLELDA